MHQNNNMNRFFLNIVFFLFFGIVSAQTLRTHTVDSRDTLEKIAQRYGVIPEDILALNPDAKNQLPVGSILVIPNPIEKKATETAEVKELVSYRVYRVKRKETLYSIAQKFDITIEDIKNTTNSFIIMLLCNLKTKFIFQNIKQKELQLFPRQ